MLGDVICVSSKAQMTAQVANLQTFQSGSKIQISGSLIPGTKS